MKRINTDQGILSVSQAYSADACFLATIAAEIHKDNANWWKDINTGEALQRNVGELLMLTVCELAEAMEGSRKNIKDDHLPERLMFEVEIMDALIRLFDICAGMGLDFNAMFEKMVYNRHRKDHKIENRKLAGGKAY